MTDQQEESDIFVGCDRLRQERLRLGWTQANAARIAGVSTKTAERWERSTPIPADRLAALAKHGLDAFFVVTGERQGGVVGEDRGTYRVKESDEEADLLVRYRRLGTDQAAAVLQLVRTITDGK